MKLIVISGAKNSKKSELAMRFAGNSDCVYIKPYSDLPVPINADPVDDMFIPLNWKQLDDKILKEVPLVETIVNGNRFVFFENQLNAEYIVLTGDDRVVFYLQHNYTGDLVTIKCHWKNEKPSPRCLMSDDEFDYVFEYGVDDYDTLEAMII